MVWWSFWWLDCGSKHHNSLDIRRDNFESYTIRVCEPIDIWSFSSLQPEKVLCVLLLPGTGLQHSDQFYFRKMQPDACGRLCLFIKLINHTSKLMLGICQTTFWIRWLLGRSRIPLQLWLLRSKWRHTYTIQWCALRPCCFSCSWTQIRRLHANRWPAKDRRRRQRRKTERNYVTLANWAR